MSVTEVSKYYLIKYNERSGVLKLFQQSQIDNLSDSCRPNTKMFHNIKLGQFRGPAFFVFVWLFLACALGKCLT